MSKTSENLPSVVPLQRGLLERSGLGMQNVGRKPKLVFAAFHGAWGSESQYRRTAEAFKRKGHELVAIQSPVDQVGHDYASMAEDAAKQLLPYQDRWLGVVANSRGCNVAALMPQLLAVDWVGYVCGTIPATKADLAAGRLRDLPIKHGDTFTSAIHDLPGSNQQLTYLDESLARQTLTFGCPPPIADEIIANLRPNIQREEDTVLNERPGVPEHAWYGLLDKVVMPEYIKAASSVLLGRDAHELPTGHLPHVSHPDMFAVRIAQVALNDYIAADMATMYE